MTCPVATIDFGSKNKYLGSGVEKGNASDHENDAFRRYMLTPSVMIEYKKQQKKT